MTKIPEKNFIERVTSTITRTPTGSSKNKVKDITVTVAKAIKRDITSGLKVYDKKVVTPTSNFIYGTGKDTVTSGLSFYSDKVVKPLSNFIYGTGKDTVTSGLSFYSDKVVKPLSKKIEPGVYWYGKNVVSPLREGTINYFKKPEQSFISSNTILSPTYGLGNGKTSTIDGINITGYNSGDYGLGAGGTATVTPINPYEIKLKEPTFLNKASDVWKASLASVGITSPLTTSSDLNIVIGGQTGTSTFYDFERKVEGIKKDFLYGGWRDNPITLFGRAYD